jgi:hypothetical protein
LIARPNGVLNPMCQSGNRWPLCREQNRARSRRSRRSAHSWLHADSGTRRLGGDRRAPARVSSRDLPNHPLLRLLKRLETIHPAADQRISSQFVNRSLEDFNVQNRILDSLPTRNDLDTHDPSLGSPDIAVKRWMGGIPVTPMQRGSAPPPPREYRHLDRAQLC